MSSQVGGIPELIDLIISDVVTLRRWNWKKELGSCSLVSPTWLLCARRYLLSTVQLGGKNVALSDDIVAFLAFITSHVCDYVQGISFRMHDKAQYDLNSQILSPLLASLPRLQSLSFFGIPFNGDTVGVSPPLPSYHIHTLKVHWHFSASRAYTDYALLDILGLFSSVDQLELSSTWSSSDSLKPYNSPVAILPHSLTTPILHITKLVLKTGSDYYMPLFRPLAQARDVRLHSLDVTDWQDFKEASWKYLAFLTDDNATLQSLALDFRDPILLTRLPEKLNHLNKILLALQSLRSFSLHVALPMERRTSVWFELSSTLSALSISIQHIKLQITPIPSNQRHRLSEFNPPWYLDSPTWRRFRVAFDRLTDLETVTFVSEGRYRSINAEEELQKITMELPALETRGLLRYENIKWERLDRLPADNSPDYDRYNYDEYVREKFGDCPQFQRGGYYS
ncbi:hypothetical protein PHLCEN_2v3963 [Hermanssonia centrifuga]|uniref:F-box domain-containing protein n=1 Tax=Hermanssonia centrifuga TaxID=98765 RepID=A0A2R6Q7H3_9APHY|nr:hypothetical protein PHLCEN_2v3963 [Hermanssonia centrifuga]